MRTTWKPFGEDTSYGVKLIPIAPLSTFNFKNRGKTAHKSESQQKEIKLLERKKTNPVAFISRVVTKMARISASKLIKLRYGRKTLSVNCFEEITGNFVVSGAMKVGKTTFLKSLQKLLNPTNMRAIYQVESETELPRTLLLGTTAIRGLGEREVFALDNKPIFTTTDRFNYLGVVTFLTKLDKEERMSRNYSKINLRIFDSPGYVELPILDSLEEAGIEKRQLEAWKGTTFRITDMLEFIVKNFPTVLAVLLSPGGPIANSIGQKGQTLIDPTDQHGFATLHEIIAEMTNTSFKASKGFMPFLGAVPILVAFTKTDQPGPKAHFEKARARAKMWKGVEAILDVSSVPYVEISKAWEKTELFLWNAAFKLSRSQR
ncbi:MAG: hypothetical protein ACFFB3_08495 [Candidatus Hodarchaeota archaeon]